MRPTLPAHFAMPDLSGLFAKNVLKLTLGRLIGQDPGPDGHPEAGLWTNLVRLTDKALREYEAGRAELAQWLQGRSHGHWSPFFRGVDYLENTITATHRAVLYGRELRRHGYGKKAVGVTTNQENVLRIMRNHIEHTDDKLLKGQIKEGEVYMLTPRERGLELGAHRLPYRTLASCIVKAHRQIGAIGGPTFSEA